MSQVNRTIDEIFLCLLGLHDWKRKSGALCCRSTVLEKRYECVRCGKYKVIFEQEKVPCKGESAL
ncbi:hypothetical protein [Methanosarcina horonobensis]|uniref:hypothetical protein n=1 Tax=Methanosarcina horonobensis TaxID=418008 RepID=UPI0022B8B5DE|nr:hypothetical protein [Methanosarcina horonobensis]